MDKKGHAPILTHFFWVVGFPFIVSVVFGLLLEQGPEAAHPLAIFLASIIIGFSVFVPILTFFECEDEDKNHAI